VPESAAPKHLPARPVRSAPEQIGSAIKEWILDGTLEPGDRLPTEEQMSAMFGVSRPTVREALRELRSAGLVSSARGRTGGYRVAEVSMRTLGAGVAEAISLSLRMQTLTYAQLFDVRVALEIQAAGAAADLRTDADLERLEAALAEVLQLPADPERVLARDLAFHRALAESTHNPLLIGFAGATAGAFRRFASDVEKISAPEMVAHLDEVVAAVAARDPEAARNAMRAHLDYFASYFRLT
jgi:GntR family transcriptional regulator, transcriptional repressor for pyruvate dehydrogenase complex